MTGSSPITERVAGMRAATAAQGSGPAGEAFARDRAELAAGGVPAGVVPPGTVLPDAELLDVHGAATTLEAVTGGGTSVLVFYRGSWCPYCNIALSVYQAAVQIAELPPSGLPNGMALDARNGDLYVSDSTLGTVWKVPAQGGAPTAWATGPSLAEASFAGANGLVIHRNAVWAGNLDKGLIVRIPILSDGSAGPAESEATGLNGGLDDFSVAGRNTIVAALNMADEVVQVQPGQPPAGTAHRRGRAVLSHIGQAAQRHHVRHQRRLFHRH
jgi:thiol-disulfide isomerase/thioredoxin